MNWSLVLLKMNHVSLTSLFMRLVSAATVWRDRNCSFGAVLDIILEDILTISCVSSPYSNEIFVGFLSRGKICWFAPCESSLPRRRQNSGMISGCFRTIDYILALLIVHSFSHCCILCWYLFSLLIYTMYCSLNWENQSSHCLVQRTLVAVCNVYAWWSPNGTNWVGWMLCKWGYESNSHS